MKNILLSFALLAGPVLHAGGLETPPLSGVRPALILVKGAVGSAEYAPRFDRQMESWKKMAVQSGAELLLAAGDVNAAAGTTHRKAWADDGRKSQGLLYDPRFFHAVRHT